MTEDRVKEPLEHNQLLGSSPASSVTSSPIKSTSVLRESSSMSTSRSASPMSPSDSSMRSTRSPKASPEEHQQSPRSENNSDDSDDEFLENLKKKKQAQRLDSDEEDANKPDEVAKSRAITADMVDSDTSDEGVIDPYPASRRSKSGSDDSEDEDSAVKDKKGRRRGGPTKTRVSKKAQKAIRDEIQRESSRMLRESAINLPYHRPKMRTLDEFLNRKKGAPEVVKDIKQKVNDALLEISEKNLELREKIAQDFFKEQEEEDGDTDDEDYVPGGTADEDENDDKTLKQQVEQEPEFSLISPEKKSLDLSETTQGKDSQQFSESLNLVLEQDTGPMLMDIDEAEINAEQIAAFEDDNIANDLLEQAQPTKQTPEKTTESTKKKSKNKLESLLGQVDPSILNEKPSLGCGGDANGSIVLEEDGRKEDLMNRFVKHVQASNKPKTNNEEDVTLTIVKKTVDRDGKEVLKAEDLKYHSKTANRQQLTTDKPGLKHLMLKEALKQKIDQAKRQERKLREKLKELEEENEGGGLFEGEDELEEEFADDEEESESEVEEDEDEVDDLAMEDRLKKMEQKRMRKANHFLDDEASEDDANEDEKEDELGTLALEEDDDDAIAPTLLFDNDDSISSDFPRLTPFDERTQAKSNNVKEAAGFEGLVDQTDPFVNDTDDIIGLCSGQFKTQPSTQDTKSQSVTQEAKTQSLAETQDTVILSNVDAESQGVPVTQNRSRIILSDDEVEGLTAHAKTKRALSDDEESDHDDEAMEEGSTEEVKNSEDEENEDEDNPGEEIMYDSDENEIKTPKPFQGFKGKRGLRKEFVDNEAELSGSDIGSDDEDERGLNRLEFEEGDLDDLDEDDLVDELGQIHQRKILDEDKRELRLFKEAFLEDGELHSDKARSRKFRWKGIDDSEELGLRQSDDEQEAAESSEVEEKRMLERVEREKWIQDSKSDDPVLISEEADSQFFNIASKALKKIEVKELQKQTSREEFRSKTRKELRSPKAKLPLQPIGCNPRGSFLSRCSKTLEKLAEITKSRDDVKSGSGAKNSKNFVFAALDTEITEPQSNQAHPGGDQVTPASGKRKRSMKSKPNSAEAALKKPRMARAIDENSVDTIFGLM